MTLNAPAALALLLPLALIGPLAGCDLFGVSVNDKDMDDSGIEADADADADADSDTDSDADSDTELDVDCDGSFSTAAPEGPDCQSGIISCGDRVYGTTEGGSAVMDEELYESAFCFVPFEFYDGTERVFELELPADTTAYIEVSTPCQDMGFAVLRWTDPNSCPTGRDHGIIECEGDGVGTGNVVQVDVFNDARYLISVDSPTGSESPFGIYVECESRG